MVNCDSVYLRFRVCACIRVRESIISPSNQKPYAHNHIGNSHSFWHMYNLHMKKQEGIIIMVGMVELFICIFFFFSSTFDCLMSVVGSADLLAWWNVLFYYLFQLFVCHLSYVVCVSVVLNQIKEKRENNNFCVSNGGKLNVIIINCRLVKRVTRV